MFEIANKISILFGGKKNIIRSYGCDKFISLAVVCTH